jgi:SAM-dependent methyltransferase
VAERLAASLGGDVLTVGGMWQRPEVPATVRLTIVDASAAMLRQAGARLPSARLVKADARALPLGDTSFDHVVLPLVLHHVAGRSGAEARQGATAVLAEAHRVLRPGGTLWISEFCVNKPIYAAECLLAPLTRRVLGLAGVPLVIMHDRAFYRDALARPSWSAVRIEKMGAEAAGPTDLITPIIGLPWIRVPRALYPLVPTLIQAQRAA